MERNLKGALSCQDVNSNTNQELASETITLNLDATHFENQSDNGAVCT